MPTPRTPQQIADDEIRMAAAAYAAAPVSNIDPDVVDPAEELDAIVDTRPRVEDGNDPLDIAELLHFQLGLLLAAFGRNPLPRPVTHGSSTAATPPERAVEAMLGIQLINPDVTAPAGATVPAGFYVSSREAERMLAAALPHLLPGMYVTREPGGDATIWRESEHPTKPWITCRPDALLQRTEENVRLFDAVAALLPDRTEED